MPFAKSSYARRIEQLESERRAREKVAQSTTVDDVAAIAMLVDAIALDPELRDAYLALGRIYRRRGHLGAELDLWRRRAELEPTDADAAERMGWILWFTGNATEALPWLRRSLELRPTGYWAQFYVGNAYLRLGEYAQAEHEYRRTLQMKPDHSSAHAGVSWALLAAGRDDDARAQLRVMQSSTLDNDRYFVKIADLELFLNDDAALPHARAAVDEDRKARYWPRGVCATTILGAALVGQDRASADRALDESATIDHAMLETGDEGPMPRYDLAAVHSLRGEFAEALRWLASAVDAGWWYPDLARRDPLLGELRQHPQFLALMRRTT